MISKDISFVSNGLLLKSRIFLADGADAKPAVLFVAGAKPGTFTKSGAMTTIRERLAEARINSIVFDHPGFGESEGDTKHSSLDSRLEDQREALRCLLANSKTDPSRLGMIGNSMGGHVLARMLDVTNGVQAIVLDRAATYGADAEDKPFDERFSASIRQPKSWVGSPALAAIQKFKGNILVIYPELDEVIPAEVQSTVKAEANDEEHILILPQVGHFFMREETAEAEAARILFIERVCAFFISSL